MQSEGDEGGICVVAESCHQTSEGIGLMASRMSKRLSLQKREKEGMQSQIIWGLALTLLGGVVAGAAIAWLPVLLIYAVPLIAIGGALLIWRGREEILEPVEE